MGCSTMEDRRMTLDSGKSQGISVKPLGMVGSTGQPSPKGAVAIAVEDCGPVASRFCLSRGARNIYFLWHILVSK